MGPNSHLHVQRGICRSPRLLLQINIGEISVITLLNFCTAFSISDSAEPLFSSISLRSSHTRSILKPSSIHSFCWITVLTYASNHPSYLDPGICSNPLNWVCAISLTSTYCIDFPADRSCQRSSTAHLPVTSLLTSGSSSALPQALYYTTPQ